MPKFLLEAKYTPDGLRAAMKESFASRHQAVAKAISALGGTLESLYFAAGESHVYLIAEFPDATDAAALGLATEATGLVRAKRIISLLTAADADRASKKSVAYRGPGTKKK